MDWLKRKINILRDTPNGGSGGGGGAATVELPEWVGTTFPEDVRTSPDYAPLFTPDKDNNPPDMAKHKTPADFLKAYKGLNELAGRKGVIVPNEKSTPEEWNKYYAALGRPDKPEGYKLTMPEKLHPSIKVTPEGQKKFFEAAHKIGLPNQMADQLNQWYLSDLSAQITQAETAQAEAAKAADAKLHETWGAKYDENSKVAELAFNAFGKDKLHPDSMKDPAIREVFYQIGSKISPDTMAALFEGGGQGGDGGGDVDKQIAAIWADPAHPFRDAKHKDHDKWQGQDGEMMKLYRKAEENKKGK